MQRSHEPHAAEWLGTVLAAALYYATLGLKVLPLVPRGDTEDLARTSSATPVDDLRLSDASDDIDQIEAWWRAHPEAQVGIVAGAGSGVIIVEYDDDTRPPTTTPLLDRLLAAGPPTFLNAHGGAGFAFFRAPPEHVGTEMLSSGMTLHGEGSVVPMSPSEGRIAARDEWLPELPPLPMPVHELRSLARLAVVQQRERRLGDPPLEPRLVSTRAMEHPLLRFTTIDSFEVERPTWLWLGWMPRRAPTLLQGNPGDGKTTLAIEIAASVTTGGTLPGSDQPVPQGDVLLLATEDDYRAVLRPRLEAAGADLSKVHVLEPSGGNVRIPRHLREIEKYVEEHNIKLVVFDPVLDYVERSTNALSDHAVRQALVPLTQLAQRQDIAVLMVRHLIKSGRGTAMHHGSGSIAFAALSRSVMVVERREDFLLLRSVKNSYGARPTSLAFRVEGEQLEALGTEVGTLEWLGPIEEEEMAAPPSKAVQAGEMLLEVLADGPVDVQGLRASAKSANVGWRTIEKAKGRLGIEQYWERRRSMWRLPSQDRNAVAPQGTDGDADLLDGREEQSR